MNEHKSITRRILAVMGMGAGLYFLVSASVSGNEIAQGALISLVSTISGFYFGAKANSL